MKKYAVLWVAVCACALLASGCKKESFTTRKVTILTQNAHLMPVSTLKKERVPCINQLVSGYDIVALQEVFITDWQDAIVRAWIKNLPTHRAITATGILTTYAEAVATSGKTHQQTLIAAEPNKKEAKVAFDRHFVLGPDANMWTAQDGGLLILTGKDYPILAASGFAFSSSSFGTLDYFASKGALYARVQVGPSDSDYVHVLNTHLQAQNAPAERTVQLIELRAFIQNVTKDDQDGHPIVLLGDFNIDGKKQPKAGDEYKTLEKELLNALPHKLHDAWAAQKNPPLWDTWVGKPWNTRDMPWGTLGNVLAVETGGPQRLDYVLYYGGQQQWKLSPSALALVPDKPGTVYCFDAQGAGPATCKTTTLQDAKCTNKSHTVSDHLGIAMTAQFRYPSAKAAAGQATPTHTPATAPQKEPRPTDTPAKVIQQPTPTHTPVPAAAPSP